MEWTRDNFLVTCDPARLDHDVIAQFLSSSYCATAIPADTVTKSVANSLCFGLFDQDRQIGFARVISDYATLAYLGDLIVMPEYSDKGLDKWLIDCILSHRKLQSLRRWILATRDAHWLYAAFGFTPLKRPEIFMEVNDPSVYRKP